MKYLKFILIVIVSLLLSSQKTKSQELKDSIANKKIDSLNNPIQKNVKFGCGFGLNFVGGTNINLSPNVIFVLSKKISLGTGLQFNYLSIKNLQTTTTLGANALFQYNLSQKLITTLEFVQLRVSRKNETTNTTNKFWDAALFIGAGINITNAISIGAKYNVLFNESQSIYTGPVIPFVNITF